MEPVVSTVLKEERLARVSHLGVVVSEFVVDGSEIFLVDLDAHFQADVFLEIEVPGAGVTGDFAIRGLGKQRTLPKRWRQLIETKRREKRLTIAHESFSVSLARFENLCQVVAAIACSFGL